jgi:uncharacterized RDD family membrane protein YckC
VTLTRTNQLLIRTPEGICFSMQLAGPVRRCLAWIIDLACIGAMSSVVGTVLGSLQLISVDFAKAIVVLAYFAISIGYGIGTEWYWRGQTVGKRLLRLRVMDVSGLRLHFSQIAIRNLLRVVDMLPAFYLVGGMACLINQRAQRLGDFAANTIVVVQPRHAEPVLDQLLAGKYNSLRDHPHLAARLRQRVSPAEARVALQALMRREDFEPASRVELFSELGRHFRALVIFPQEAVEGISDEQYVRNVVDVLFRSRSPEEIRNPASREPAASASLSVNSAAFADKKAGTT